MLTKQPSSSRNVKWLVIGGAAIALGATTWAVVGRGSSASAGVAVPPEFTKEALKAKMDEGPGGFAAMREVRDREDLTDEQKRQIADNAREIWRERMDANVNEYFSAKSEDEKNTLLDREIDRMAEQAKRFEEQRKEWEKRREERRAEGGNRPTPTQQERKERSESRNPDQTARMMAYFSAMRDRAASRGIQMPDRPGGFGGPGGPGGPRRNGP